LEQLEILGDDWRELLKKAQSCLGGAVWKEEHPSELWIERTGVYFVFRHWLHSVWDGDLLSQAELAAFGVCVTALLSAFSPFSEALRMFGREIEHCAENLSALKDSFWHQLSLEGFLRALAYLDAR